MTLSAPRLAHETTTVQASCMSVLSDSIVVYNVCLMFMSSAFLIPSHHACFVIKSEWQT